MVLNPTLEKTFHSYILNMSLLKLFDNFYVQVDCKGINVTRFLNEKLTSISDIYHSIRTILDREIDKFITSYIYTLCVSGKGIYRVEEIKDRLGVMEGE